MVALKAYEVDRYLASPPEAMRMFLVYGSDAGAVTERARSIERRALQRGGGQTVVRFGSDELSANPGIVADEANSASLFGGEPVVALRVLDGRHNVVGALQPLLDRPPDAAWVIVEAADLQATNPLRKAFETSKAAVTLPTYPLEGRSLVDFIEAAAADAGLRIEPAAVELLADGLGGDRLTIRGELEKLFLYAGDARSVALADAAAIIGDAAGAETDTVIDAALVGDSNALETGLQRLRADAASFASLGAAALRHLILLQSIGAAIAAGRPLADALNYARPPIFKRRRSAVETEVRTWSMERIAAARRRMDEAVYLTRLRPGLEDSAISAALHGLALEARRMRRASAR